LKILKVPKNLIFWKILDIQQLVKYILKKKEKVRKAKTKSVPTMIIRINREKKYLRKSMQS
jgi:hypothetical protein